MAKWWVMPSLDHTFYDRARKASDKLEEVENILGIMAQLSMVGGGPITWTLSGLSVVGRVLNMTIPTDMPYEYLSNRGFRYSQHAMDKYIVRWVLASDAPYITKNMSDFSVRMYEGLGIAIFNGSEGPVLYKKEDFNIDAIVDAHFWKDLDHEVYNTVDHDGTSIVTFRTLPAVLPKYVGNNPSVDQVCQRLLADGKRSKTVFFYGPSGAGKSSLARNVARVSHPNCRLLRFSTRQLGDWGPSAMVQVLTLLRPTAILIDDGQMLMEGNQNTFNILIDVMENIHHAGEDQELLVMGTIMTDSPTPFREGMRPGRVDRWVYVGPPSVQDIEAIYQEYLTVEIPDHLVHSSRALTGAYLQEVARRVNNGSWWRREVADVKLTLQHAYCIVVPGEDSIGIGLVAYAMQTFTIRGTISIPDLHKKVARYCHGLTHEDSIMRIVQLYDTHPDDAKDFYEIQSLAETDNSPKPSRLPPHLDDGEEEVRVEVEVPDVMVRDIVDKILTIAMGRGWQDDDQCQAALTDQSVPGVGWGQHQAIIREPPLARHVPRVAGD